MPYFTDLTEHRISCPVGLLFQLVYILCMSRRILSPFGSRLSHPLCLKRTQFPSNMKSEDQVQVSDDKSAPVYDNDKEGLHESSSDAERASTEVELVETTKRGLKARHAQMIALGGTIGNF